MSISSSHRFGSEKSAIVLAEILKEDKNSLVSRKVSRTINLFMRDIKAINKVVEDPVRAKCIILLRDDTLKKIDTLNLPTNILSFIHNIICTRTTMFIRREREKQLKEFTIISKLNSFDRLDKIKHLIQIVSKNDNKVQIKMLPWRVKLISKILGDEYNISKMEIE